MNPVGNGPQPTRRGFESTVGAFKRPVRTSLRKRPASQAFINNKPFKRQRVDEIVAGIDQLEVRPNPRKRLYNSMHTDASASPSGLYNYEFHASKRMARGDDVPEPVVRGPSCSLPTSRSLWDMTVDPATLARSGLPRKYVSSTDDEKYDETGGRGPAPQLRELATMRGLTTTTPVRVLYNISSGGAEPGPTPLPTNIFRPITSPGPASKPGPDRRSDRRSPVDNSRAVIPYREPTTIERELRRLVPRRYMTGEMAPDRMSYPPTIPRPKNPMASIICLDSGRRCIPRKAKKPTPRVETMDMEQPNVGRVARPFGPLEDDSRRSTRKSGSSSVDLGDQMEEEM